MTQTPRVSDRQKVRTMIDTLGLNLIYAPKAQEYRVVSRDCKTEIYKTYSEKALIVFLNERLNEQKVV